MNVDLHKVKAIKSSQRHWKSGLPFFCLELELTTQSDEVHTIRLFSDEAMMLINPEVREVE